MDTEIHTDVKKAYSDPTWWYDIRGFFILTFAYNDTLWRQISFFAKHIKDTHLEIGVGSGTLFKMILQWRNRQQPTPSHLTLTDYVPSMLTSARKKFKNQKNITVEVADATNLSYAEASFDSVSVANSLHCIENLDAALTEIVRVLRPDGVFSANIIIEPTGSGILATIAHKINAWGKQKGILYKTYTVPEVLTKYQQAGLTVTYQKHTGNVLYLVAQRT